MARDLEHLKPHYFTSENQPKRKGKRPGTKNFRNLYKEFLKVAIEVGKLTPEIRESLLKFTDKKALDAKEIIVINDIARAMHGNDKAIDRIQNRVENLPTQRIITSKEEYLDDEDLEKEIVDAVMSDKTVIKKIITEMNLDKDTVKRIIEEINIENHAIKKIGDDDIIEDDEQ